MTWQAPLGCAATDPIACPTSLPRSSPPTHLPRRGGQGAWHARSWEGSPRVRSVRVARVRRCLCPGCVRSLQVSAGWFPSGTVAGWPRTRPTPAAEDDLSRSSPPKCLIFSHTVLIPVVLAKMKPLIKVQEKTMKGSRRNALFVSRSCGKRRVVEWLTAGVGNRNAQWMWSGKQGR